MSGAIETQATVSVLLKCADGRFRVAHVPKQELARVEELRDKPAERRVALQALRVYIRPLETEGDVS